MRRSWSKLFMKWIIQIKLLSCSCCLHCRDRSNCLLVYASWDSSSDLTCFLKVYSIFFVIFPIWQHLHPLNSPFKQELECEFLRRRGAYLDSQVAEILPSNMTASQPSASTYTALSKYLDMMRLTLFEIVTQFRAVFGDASSNVRIFSTFEHFWKYFFHQNFAFRIHRVMCFMCGCFLASTTSSLCWSSTNFYFKSIVFLLAHMACHRHVPSLHEGAYLSNLLEQAMHCGSSLGRIGLDFRGSHIWSYLWACHHLNSIRFFFFLRIIVWRFRAPSLHHVGPSNSNLAH